VAVAALAAGEGFGIFGVLIKIIRYK
jgi:hypothetical protein